jgi:sulfite oxidase
MALWGKRDDMITHEVEPYNAEAPSEALAGRTLTPLNAFFARDHGPIPRLDGDTWGLTVGGLVDRPLILSLADLRAGFARRDVVATLQCAGNRRAGLQAVRPIPGQTPWGSGAISTARWTGVGLADVLDRAGPGPGAAHVEFTAPDVAPEAEPPQAFGGSIPLAKAIGGDVLLAWEMNGRPLPPVHGGPVRVIVPGYVGARSVKWVTGVTVRERPSDNYFQAVAYRLMDAPLGPVPPGADILAPGEGAVVPAGPVMVHGYAFGGDEQGIDRVEVSPDGGLSWRPAELDPAYGPWAWRLWRAVLDLPPGETTVVARVWDADGGCQPGSAAALWNPEGYANNACPRVRIVVT